MGTDQNPLVSESELMVLKKMQLLQKHLPVMCTVYASYLLLHPISCSSLGHHHFGPCVKHHPRCVWKKVTTNNFIVGPGLESHLQFTVELSLQKHTSTRHLQKLLGESSATVYEKRSNDTFLLGRPFVFFSKCQKMS